jgi:hypothetical protein
MAYLADHADDRQRYGLDHARINAVGRVAPQQDT